jgi:hypothetical protein
MDRCEARNGRGGIRLATAGRRPSHRGQGADLAEGRALLPGQVPWRFMGHDGLNQVRRQPGQVRGERRPHTGGDCDDRRGVHPFQECCCIGRLPGDRFAAGSRRIGGVRVCRLRSPAPPSRVGRSAHPRPRRSRPRGGPTRSPAPLHVSVGEVLRDRCARPFASPAWPHRLSFQTPLEGRFPLWRALSAYLSIQGTVLIQWTILT